MPVELHFENNGSGALLIARDYMAKGELLEANAKMYEVDTEGRLQYQIVDLTQLEQEELSVENFQKLVAMDKQAASDHDGLKVAVVVKRGLLEAISEVYSQKANDENLHTKLFETVADAREWISH